MLRRWRYRVLIMLSIAMIAAGVFLLVKPAAAPADLHSPALSNSAPSSKKPSTAEIANYTVAPDVPRYINIPAIGVEKTRILQLGLTKNDQIGSPNNIYDVGWYRGSAKPGQAGAMFMFGHVSSWTANGIFHDLKRLKAGDRITIERGDGKRLTYAVKTTKTYSATNVDMHAVLSAINPNIQGLNLMTCAGQVIKGTSDFDHRLVVFASLVS